MKVAALAVRSAAACGRGARHTARVAWRRKRLCTEIVSILSGVAGFIEAMPYEKTIIAFAEPANRPYIAVGCIAIAGALRIVKAWMAPDQR